MRRTIVFVGAAFLGFAACSHPASPKDKIRQVVVVTDDRTDLELPLQSILGASSASQPGPQFNLRFERPDNFEAVTTAPTLFIIGTPTDDPIKELIGTTFTDTFGLFEIKDRWAKGQLVLILVAQNEGYFVPALEHYRSRVLFTLRSHYLDQTKTIVYQHGYNQKLRAQLEKNCQFHLDVPSGFSLVEPATGKNFISFVARDPDRTISVFWRPASPTDQPVDALTLMNIRDSLFSQLDSGVTIDRDVTAAETTNFLDRTAVFISGIWQDAHGRVGGPFICYGFTGHNRLYLIDGSLASTDKSKLDYIDQMEIIIETFKP